MSRPKGKASRYTGIEPITPELEKRLLHWLRESELSTYRIAQRFNVNQREVERIRDENGLKKRYVSTKPEDFS